MNCPNCKKSNPEDATKCECGYVFKGYQESTSGGVTGVASKSDNNNEVVITDIKMTFGSMVEFMVKWAIASIPAFIILFLIGFLVIAIIPGAISLFN